MKVYEAISSHQIIHLGNTFYITANIFKYSVEQNKKIKIIKKIQTPLSLKIKLNEKEEEYFLKSIVVHSGNSTEFGHYYCIGYEKGEWIKFNDCFVSIYSEKEMKELFE